MTALRELDAALKQARATDGAPGAGTTAVDTITFIDTISSGTFRLKYGRNAVTAAITWSNTNNTLRDRVDAALEALAEVPAGGVTTAVGTMTLGIGTLTVTHALTNAKKKSVPAITVYDTTLVGGGSITAERTTPGVDADFRRMPANSYLVDLEAGKVYKTTVANPPVFSEVT